MGNSSTVLNQILHFIPRHVLKKVIERYDGDRYVKSFKCRHLLTAVLYAQAQGLESIRDIVANFDAHPEVLYHLGMERVKKSTFADANNIRDYRIWRDLFYELLKRCETLTPDHKFGFKNPLYSLDSTVIGLCLSIFPWAKYTQEKGALKIHTLLNHRGNIPSFIATSDGTKADISVAKETDLPLLPDSILTMDRGYLDFEYLRSLDRKRIFFVIRARRGFAYRITGQHDIPKVKNLVADLTVELTGVQTSLKYPGKLRVVRWHNEELDYDLEFITNNFNLSAATIAGIYKNRWEIEIFFKWIKQNLHIKTFLGTSENAVLTQVWIAMCYYLILAFIHFQTNFKGGMLKLSRLIRATLLHKTHLINLLSLDPDVASGILRAPPDQLELF